MLTLAALPTLIFGATRWVLPALALLLLVAQIPLTFRLIRRTGQARYLGFALMSFVRAFYRGVGLTAGVLAWFARGHGQPNATPPAAAEGATTSARQTVDEE